MMDSTSDIKEIKEMVARICDALHIDLPKNISSTTRAGIEARAVSDVAKFKERIGAQADRGEQMVDRHTPGQKRKVPKNVLRFRGRRKAILSQVPGRTRRNP